MTSILVSPASAWRSIEPKTIGLNVCTLCEGRCEETNKSSIPSAWGCGKIQRANELRKVIQAMRRVILLWNECIRRSHELGRVVHVKVSARGEWMEVNGDEGRIMSTLKSMTVKTCEC